ncbi:MAG: hypothetical protein JWP89_1589 [Schlesneria sp.]|nr:hypothetical protein [Schlesneria sp.]
MKKPVDREFSEETKTVVSRIRKFHGIGGTVSEEHIRCPRIANTVQYGDTIIFDLFLIPDDRLSNLQHAIDVQADQPLTEQRLVSKFGGVKMGGGVDDAKFDANGKMIAPALEFLKKRYHP